MRHTLTTIVLTIAVSIASLSSHVACAQVISTQADCNAIGGQWDLNVPRPQFARCALTQYYLVDAGRRLELDLGVELEIRGNGVLHNRGQILILNTAQLDIQGVFTNEGLVVADNRAEIFFRRGQVNNNGRMEIEGDIFIVNTARLPSGWRECWYNSGSIMLTSGGNLFNRGGCLDGDRGGALDVQLTGTFVNEANAFYRGGRSDVITGIFRNERGGWAQLRNMRLLGEFENHGDAYLTEGSNASQDNSETRISETGILRIDSNSQVSIGTRRFRVDGVLEVLSGRLRDANRPLQVNVGSGGDIQLYGSSVAWSPASQIELNNSGSIVKHCLATWYSAMIPRGNPVYHRRCYPVPIPSPWPIPLPNPIFGP
ncbi:MAG: hypothetical protein AAGL69_17260 [Pseudomonadota bacterium]